MAVTTVIFAIMTYFYKYVDNTAAGQSLANLTSDKEALVKSSEGADPPQPPADNEKK